MHRHLRPHHVHQLGLEILDGPRFPHPPPHPRPPPSSSPLVFPPDTREALRLAPQARSVLDPLARPLELTGLHPLPPHLQHTGEPLVSCRSALLVLLPAAQNRIQAKSHPRCQDPAPLWVPAPAPTCPGPTVGPTPLADDVAHPSVSTPPFPAQSPTPARNHAPPGHHQALARFPQHPHPDQKGRQSQHSPARGHQRLLLLTGRHSQLFPAPARRPQQVLPQTGRHSQVFLERRRQQLHPLTGHPRQLSAAKNRKRLFPLVGHRRQLFAAKHRV
mmetsp:Transcript_58550/g.155885  ORF Transcript_58550/g.155885 Transcript_58550/m.155885 type:complete len:274 (-) Transcript_58550:736-1557(-)